MRFLVLKPGETFTKKLFDLFSLFFSEIYDPKPHKSRAHSEFYNYCGSGVLDFVSVSYVMLVVICLLFLMDPSGVSYFCKFALRFCPKEQSHCFWIIYSLFINFLEPIRI